LFVAFRSAKVAFRCHVLTLRYFRGAKGDIHARHQRHTILAGCRAGPVAFDDASSDGSADFLENNPNVLSVKYPLLKSHPQYEVAKKQMKLGGNVVAFEVKGGIEAGRSFLNNIKLCSLSANLGDTRTIVTHPASTTHSKLTVEERLAVSITDGLVRVSVGLETVQDIINDLDQALTK
jgi:O-acetylhomoserine/O-acetylserine sulfhydrylase-like pyridoxal-dependent enzyme